MAKKPIEAPSTLEGVRKEFMKLIRANAHRYDLWTVFSDFLQLAACTYSNAVDLVHYEEREAEYMKTVGKYSKEEVDRFCRALAYLTDAMSIAGFADVLGSIFMELELGNKWTGQFFTPYCVAHMMGKMTVGDGEHARKEIEEKGFIEFNDPCIGGGAMVIGFAHALHDVDINYQQCMHAIVQDIDIKAVHMAYIQMTLLHIPGIIIHGNSLALEQRSIWYTPAHILHYWQGKLGRAKRMRAEALAKEALSVDSLVKPSAEPENQPEPSKSAVVIELPRPTPAATSEHQPEDDETKSAMGGRG